MEAAIHNQTHTPAWSGPGQKAYTWLAAMIVMLHVLLALVWGVVVPLGEGPDEPGHFNYALFLAQNNRLPIQQAEPDQSDVPGEGHQPPLAYWLMQPAVRWLPVDERVLEIGEDTEFIHNGGIRPNAFFRRSADVWPYTGQALAWHLARGLSALLGGMSVWLTYLIARRCFPDQRWLALGASGILALNPQFIFAHALVSNDPLLITLSTALLYSCVVIIGRQLGDEHRMAAIQWVLIAGVILGLMLITKQSSIAFVPLPFLALTLSSRSVKQWMLHSVLVGVLAVALCWWWYNRNLRLYGDWLGVAAFQETFAAGNFDPSKLQDWTNGLWNLLRSSWGNFGWQTLPMNDGAYWAFAVFLALAVIGLLTSVGKGWWTGRGRVALLLITSSALMVVWTIAFARLAGVVAWQGRFLFPAGAAIVTVVACGLGAALPQRSALWTMLGLLGVLAVGLPFGLLRPTYGSYVLPTQPADFGNVYGRFDIGWKQGVELRDVQLPGEVIAGDTIPITLTWHALEQMDRPWSVFIHLVNTQEEIIDEQNAQPVGGAFPMSSWVGGDWVRDTHQITLQHAIPGEYRLWIGLWDPDTGARLGVYDREGTLVNDRIEVGPILIMAKNE